MYIIVPLCGVSYVLNKTNTYKTHRTIDDILASRNMKVSSHFVDSQAAMETTAIFYWRCSTIPVQYTSRQLSWAE